MIARAVALAALLPSAAAHAQAYRCPVPAGALPVRPEPPTADQPRRLLPIGGYTLAISWAPRYCRAHGQDPAARLQCRDGRFGWTLHGLWPDGEGRDWPQYCRAAALLPSAVIRRHLCATPSAQLLQHEWAKHGTCMAGYTPERYFARPNALYARLRYPDMKGLSRAPLTAGGVAAAMAGANPGLTPDMMRVTADRHGWLDELWLCLDRRFRHTRCPAGGGLAPNAPVGCGGDGASARRSPCRDGAGPGAASAS